MPNELLWGAPDTIATILSTELNSLGASGGTSSVGSEIDNTTNKNRFATFQLEVDFATAPTAGGLISLYFSLAMDGTNYLTTVDDRFAIHVCDFVVANTAVAARIPGRTFSGPSPLIYQLPPLKIKPYLVNNADQAFPASGSIVEYVTFNEELQ